MVESDCDLLSLRLGTGLSSPSRASDSGSRRMEGKNFDQQEQQKITIFYGDRICVCDVTEIQARAIINMAKREMEERTNKNQQQNWLQGHKSLSPPQSPPPSPHDSVPQLLNPGLSMKRSLQRFLQKRKTRIDATAPYVHSSRRGLMQS